MTNLDNWFRFRWSIGKRLFNWMATYKLIQLPFWKKKMTKIKALNRRHLVSRLNGAVSCSMQKENRTSNLINNRIKGEKRFFFKKNGNIIRLFFFFSFTHGDRIIFILLDVAFWSMMIELDQLICIATLFTLL